MPAFYMYNQQCIACACDIIMQHESPKVEAVLECDIIIQLRCVAMEILQYFKTNHSILVISMFCIWPCQA